MTPAPNAWDVRLERHVRNENHSRVIELVLFAGLCLPIAVPLLPFPLSELCGLALLGLAILRRPVLPRPLPLWFPWLLAAILALMAISALLNGVPSAQAVRRLGHIGVYAGLATFLATGRLDRLSAVRGLGVGLGIVGVTGMLSLAGIAFSGQGYEGRLTGLVRDPNAVGYYFTTLGCLALTGARPGWRRQIALLGVVVVTTLTYSRTAILALALVIVWLLLRRKVHPVPGLVVVGGAAALLAETVQTIRLAGPFESRGGSDALRERILEQEWQKIAASPWLGNGPGTSTVTVGEGANGLTFFFHNSYLSVRNEIGWFGLSVTILLFLLVVVRLVRLSRPERHPWHEASLIAVAVCAMSLGEAIFELPAAIVLGLAMRHTLQPHELRVSDASSSSDHAV